MLINGLLTYHWLNMKFRLRHFNKVAVHKVCYFSQEDWQVTLCSLSLRNMGVELDTILDAHIDLLGISKSAHGIRHLFYG